MLMSHRMASEMMRTGVPKSIQVNMNHNLRRWIAKKNFFFYFRT